MAGAGKRTVTYLLDIACRDYDFLSYGVDVGGDGVVKVYRVSRGGGVVGEKVAVGEEAVEVRVLRGREFYEGRAGCEWALATSFFLSRWGCGGKGRDKRRGGCRLGQMECGC